MHSPKNNKPGIKQQTPISSGDLDQIVNGIVHDWLRTLTILLISLVPLFFFLDYYFVPRELLAWVGFYRLLGALIVIVQYFIIRTIRPSRFSLLHGYIVSIVVGSVIVLMTVNLSGFNSSYYIALNLVFIGVNLLLPWWAIHRAINRLIVARMNAVLARCADHQASQPEPDFEDTGNQMFFHLKNTLVG